MSGVAFGELQTSYRIGGRSYMSSLQVVLGYSAICGDHKLRHNWYQEIICDTLLLQYA